MSSIPHFFICPISLELFTDPVTLCTGQTYDRPCIEKWLAAGNLTCPVTMLKLHDFSMIPNNTLKHLIHQWLQKTYQNQQFDDDIDHCFCKVGDSDVPITSLKHVIGSQESSFEHKIEALDQVGCFLFDELPNKKEVLIKLGFFPLLVELVFGANFSQEMMGLVEKALYCVLKLIQFCYLEHLNMLLVESKFENFKVLFKEGTFKVKISLCNIIEAICNSSTLQTKELVTKIGNETKILQGLITSLQDYQQHPGYSEAGIKAILGLLTSSQGPCRENLIKEGLVHSLVSYIVEVERQEKSLAPKATRALELVLELESGKESFLVNKVPNGVKSLVKMVFRVSGDEIGIESAVNSLMILCCESKEVREEAICGGLLTQLLLLLQSQCSGRAKTKARMLLKLLRSMWA